MEVKETTKNTKILENNTKNLIDSDNNNFDNSNSLRKNTKKSFKERLKGLFTIRRVCVETSKSKAAEVEDNLNSSKAKVEGLTEIVEKNATIR